METIIPNGVWPTMITPFTENDKIDYNCLETLIEWYIDRQVDGLFAVCQSSEMFFLSLKERTELARFVADKAKGRVAVVASGHISNDLDDQIYEMKCMADTGVDACVLISNRFASKDESDDIWKLNLERFLREFPDNKLLGFYECPYPYKRLVSPELLKWCASTGRFAFLKDTSCDPDNIKAKVKAVHGTGLKIYNANAATLYMSLVSGSSGYSGIMANMFPQLFVWLTRNWSEKPEEAQRLQNFLGAVAAIEKRLYPICAKQYLQLDGIDISLNTRSQDISNYLPAYSIEIRQLYDLAKEYLNMYQL